MRAILPSQKIKSSHPPTGMISNIHNKGLKMEFLVWLLLLPIFVIVKAIVVGSPKLATGVAQATYALENAESVYEDELKRLKEKK
jgi:hypothetical protein